MRRWRRWGAALLAVALLFSACAQQGMDKGADGGQQLNPDYQLSDTMRNMEILPQHADDFGVSTDSAFVLQAPGNPSIRELEESLVFQPQVEFVVEQAEGGQLLLVPAQPLESGQVYTVAALSPAGNTARTWAFQTKRRFGVITSTPYHGAGGVAPDTGIEFRFTYEDVDISEHFEIVPHMEGAFVTQGDRSAFTPKERLAYNTTYTATLKAGLPAPDGSLLEEDYVVEFVTREQPYIDEVTKLDFYVSGGFQETFLSSDSPLLQLTAYHVSDTQPFQVEAYAISPERYMEELLGYYRYLYDPDYKYDGMEYTAEITADMDPAYSFSTTVTNVESNNSYAWYPKYLIFPEAVDPGHYLVTASATDPGDGTVITRQKLIQVNDTSVHLQSVNGDALAWLNDAVSGQGMEGAQIELVQPWKNNSALAQGTTDQTGIARFEVKEQSLALVHIVPPESVAYAAPWEELPQVLDIVAEDGDSEEPSLDLAPQEESAPIESAAEPTAAATTSPDRRPDYWDFVSLSPQSEPTVRESYTAFAYTDRELYMPTDTIRIWGVLRGRREPIAPGTTVEVRLFQGYSYNSYNSDYDYYWGGGSEEHLLSVEVTLEEDGTFIGAMDLEKLQSGQYFLSVCAPDGRGVFNIPVEIRRYQKPQYKSTAYTDKEFYLPGEEVDINALYTLFEGTPVWGVELAARIDSALAQQTVTLDQNGVARLTTTLEHSRNSWRPTNMRYHFWDSRSGNVLPRASGSFYYFPSDTILQMEQQGAGSSPELLIKTNSLDTSRLGSAGDIFVNYPNNFLGAPVDTELEVVITETTWTRKVESAYYDWTAKKSVNRYSYSSSTQEYSRYTVSTKDGVAVLKDLPKPAWSTSYRVIVKAKDSQGREIQEEITLSRGQEQIYNRYFDSSSNIKSYYYNLVDPPRQQLEEYYYSYYGALQEYRLEDVVKVALGSSHPGEQFQGQLLYTVTQDKILTLGVSGEDVFQLPYVRDYIPNVRIQGAYFDGKYIYPVSYVGIRYDSADEELGIQITPDSQRYRPGDEVELEIRITDTAGSPVVSRVSLSVVDEAMFALREQELNPLEALYRVSFFRSAITYSSHVQHLFYVIQEGGKGGGGDGEAMRENFEDTAQFISVETDSSGVATLRFQLPDNITSWRITGVAVAQDELKAGTTYTNIDASLPLFVQPVYNDTYLEGDDVALSMVCYGTAVTRSTPVRYTASLTPLEGGNAVEREIKGRTDRYTTINFGQVPAGRYRMEVWAETNQDKDGVAYEVEVVLSAMELPVVRDIVLSDDGTSLDINPGRYPVLIGFADNEYQSYFQAAKTLLRRNTARADRRVAALVAKESMLQYMDEEDARWLDYINVNLDSFVNAYYYQNTYGLRLYSYDSTEVLLTAKAVAVLGPENEHTQAFLGYLTEQMAYASVDYSAEDKAAVLMARAAMRQPVLLEIQDMLDRMDMQSDECQLYLITGLALLGDTDGATARYEERIAPRIANVGNTKVFYDKSYTEDKNEMLTAMALGAASAMGHEDRDALLQMVLKMKSITYDPWMEIAMYIRCFQPTYLGGSAFQYKKNGATHQVELKQDGVKYISFMASDLAGDTLRSTRGEVAATAFYVGDAQEYRFSSGLEEEEIGEGEDDGQERIPVTIQRTIRPARAQEIEEFLGEDWGAGQLEGMFLVKLTVRFEPEAPLGNYEIVDRIPSPLRFEGFSYQVREAGRTSLSVWHSREEQNMRIQLNRYRVSINSLDSSDEDQWNKNEVYEELGSGNSAEITYLTRMVYHAWFGGEDVFLQHAQTGIATYGETRVTAARGSEYKRTL